MSHLSPYPVAPPSCPLVARVASVALLCYTAFLSSRRAGWLLLVALSPYRLALPSHPPVAPDVVLSSRWLVVICHVAFVALLSWAALPCLVRPIVLCCPLVLLSPLSPYYVAPPATAHKHNTHYKQHEPLPPYCSDTLPSSQWVDERCTQSWHCGSQRVQTSIRLSPLDFVSPLLFPCFGALNEDTTK